jgi:hypothetical protein
VVGHVDGSVNSIQEDEVPFNLITQGEVFDVDMLCPRGGFLGVAHCGTSIVILIKKSCCFLWNVEIPEYASDEKDHLTRVIRSHKFSFSRQTGDRRLEFAFICDRATSEANVDAAERLSRFDTRGPVRVKGMRVQW